MDAALFTDLLGIFAEVAVLAGFFGAALYMFLRTLALEAWAEVEKTQWYMDWEDRQYVRWFNATHAPEYRMKAAKSEDGNADPGALAFVAVVAFCCLAACTTVDAPLTGSDVWWDKVKRGVVVQPANYFLATLTPYPLSFSSRNPRGSRRVAVGGRVQALSVVVHGVGRQSGDRRSTLWATASPLPKAYRRYDAPRSLGHIADMTSPISHGARHDTG